MKRSILLVAAFLAVACSGTDKMPGTALGTFSVTAKQAANTCGSGLGAADPWTFNMELSLDGSTLYWREPGGTVSAALDSSNQAKFSGTYAESEGGEAGVPLCTLTRTDTTLVKLDSKTDAKAVSGTVSFGYTIDSGTDCKAALAASGGVFDTLPCLVTYSFEGSRTKAP